MRDESPINRNLKAGDWFRLSTGNDWGVNYLARDPLKRSFYEGRWSSGGASSARRYRLESGDSLRVRVLDGSERDGIVRMQTNHSTVNDMGHEYAVSYAVPCVAFPDGSEVQLTVAEIRYEPERDPTRDEVEAE